MKKCIITAFLFFLLAQSFGQRKVSTYLQAQFNPTLYDRTLPNNPLGLGFGLQAFLRTSSRFSATVDITADVYGGGDRALRLNPDGTPIESVEGMVNVFAGACYHPSQRVFLSVVTGPSFIGGQTFLGMKPSIGCYFPKNKRWMGKISLVNVFNRDERTKDEFGALSLSLGVRLF